MEVDESTLQSHVTTSCLHLQLAPLIPAVISLKAALVSQMMSMAHCTASQLENLVQYLIRVPRFGLCELQPVLMWRYGVSFNINIKLLWHSITSVYAFFPCKYV